MTGTPAHQRRMRVAEEGLHQREDGVRADARSLDRAMGGQHAHRAHAHRGQQGHGLILDHVGQGADDQQLARVGGGQGGDERGKTGILALREGRLDAGTRVVVDPHAACGMRLVQAFGGAGEIKLDDLGRAGAHKEQLPDVGTARQQARDLAVQFGIGIGQTRQILFFKDRGAEAGFSKDHHTRRRLQQMRAGAAAHHEKEGILHLAVQPDDSREAAEHLALAAFLEDGHIAAAGGGGGGHARASASSRAMRSFHRN